MMKDNPIVRTARGVGTPKDTNAYVVLRSANSAAMIFVWGPLNPEVLPVRWLSSPEQAGWA